MEDEEGAVAVITMRLRRAPVGVVIRMTSTLDVACPQLEQVQTFTSVDAVSVAVRRVIEDFQASEDVPWAPADGP